MFFHLFDPMEEKAVSLMNVLQIAYVGDAVWEIIIRNQLIRKGLNVHHMHSECIKRVNAASQAAYLEALTPYLNPSEMDLVRRGRNAHPHHAAPKNQDPGNYSLATAFETLIGYLYLTGNTERLQELVHKLIGGNEHG